MEVQCEQEVIRIHGFFVAWLNGTLANSQELFETECTCVLADDLVLIKTNGQVIHHDELQSELRNLHGIQRGYKFDMEIHDFQALQTQDGKL